MKKRAFNILFLSCCIVLLNSTIVCNAQFTFVGDARFSNQAETEITLTDAVNWQNGSIWFSESIDLNNSFSIDVDLYFGIDDGGADGIAFGLQTTGTGVGEQGQGIGMGNISPLLAVEFDTYQNLDFADPLEDHIALIRDGVNDHNSVNNLEGPVVSPTLTNFENGQWYNAKFVWNAGAKQFDVYFNCELVISRNIDITNEIFNGQNEVFWGFTSATGGLNNEHKIGLKELTFFDTDTLYICKGNSVSLSARTDNNGDNYVWYDPDGTVIGNTSTVNHLPIKDTNVYTVTFTQEVPCVEDQLKNYVVIQQGQELGDIRIPDEIINCITPVIIESENTSPSVSYQWLYNNSSLPGETTSSISAENEGMYILQFSITIKSGETCRDSDTTIFTVPQIPKPNLGSDIAQCNLPVELMLMNNVSPAYDLQWLYNDVIINGATNSQYTAQNTGTYILQIDSANCSNADTIEVSLLETPLPTILPDEDICINETQIYSITTYPGTSAITWKINPANSNLITQTGGTNNEDNITLTGENAGTIQLIVLETRNTCDVSDTIDIDIKPLPVINIDPIAPLCLNSDNSVPLSATPPGGTFSGEGVNGSSLSPSEIQSTSDTSIFIFYDVTDASGCSSIDSIEADFIYVPEVTITINDETVCRGDQTVLLVTPFDNSYRYDWFLNTDIFQNNGGNNVVVSEGGSYRATISKNGCENQSNSVNLTIVDIEVEAEGPYFIDFGASQELNAVVNVFPTENVSVQWLRLPDSAIVGNALTTTVSPTELTTYLVKAQSASGCVATAETVVDLVRPITIPEIISPNGDGDNDIWKIENLEDYPINNVKIYNRWGNAVYEQDNYFNDWGGTRNGNDLPVATYYYHVMIVNPKNEEKINFYGPLTIIK